MFPIRATGTWRRCGTRHCLPPPTRPTPAPHIKQQPADAAGQRQRALPELPRRHGRGRRYRTIRHDPHARKMDPGRRLRTHLQSSHPFSLVKPMQDNIDLVATLAPKARLAIGPERCSSSRVRWNVLRATVRTCRPSTSSRMNFLVRDSSNGQMCLACHDPKRTPPRRHHQVNPLAGWAIGVHATAHNQVSTQANLGSYGTVSSNACISCHAPHNARARRACCAA